MFDLWRARLAWRDAVRRVHRHGRLGGLPEDDQAHVLFNLTDHYFSRNSGQFLRLGRALLRWDGVGDVPTVSEIDREGATNGREINESIDALLEWRAPGNARIRGHRCPACTGRYVLAGVNDMATTHSGLAADWDLDHNLQLKPTDVYAYTARQIWWVCRQGHTCRESGRARMKRGGCRECPTRMRPPMKPEH